MSDSNPYQPVPREQSKTTWSRFRLPLALALIIGVFAIVIAAYLAGFYRGLRNGEEMERRGEGERLRVLREQRMLDARQRADATD